MKRIYEAIPFVIFIIACLHVAVWDRPVTACFFMLMLILLELRDRP